MESTGGLRRPARLGEKGLYVASLGLWGEVGWGAFFCFFYFIWERGSEGIGDGG